MLNHGGAVQNRDHPDQRRIVAPTQAVFEAALDDGDAVSAVCDQRRLDGSEVGLTAEAVDVAREADWLQRREFGLRA